MLIVVSFISGPPKVQLLGKWGKFSENDVNGHLAAC